MKTSGKGYTQQYMKNVAMTTKFNKPNSQNNIKNTSDNQVIQIRKDSDSSKKMTFNSISNKTNIYNQSIILKDKENINTLDFSEEINLSHIKKDKSTKSLEIVDARKETNSNEDNTNKSNYISMLTTDKNKSKTKLYQEEQRLFDNFISVYQKLNKNRIDDSHGNLPNPHSFKKGNMAKFVPGSKILTSESHDPDSIQNEINRYESETSIKGLGSILTVPSFGYSKDSGGNFATSEIGGSNTKTNFQKLLENNIYSSKPSYLKNSEISKNDDFLKKLYFKISNNNVLLNAEELDLDIATQKSLVEPILMSLIENKLAFNFDNFLNQGKKIIKKLK